ncbi:SDR family oxidoreductase [Paeniglutamicibacter gangotriensis]|uniref:SDR family oxidoreductase n=1 Tax=Paeniglutamicibacter gangotriensis TaxID=254787 RepID=A0A5B0EG41_9MICC|nr:SDR family oxidoreductase [Paeniglutamicibacter gangotriensis]KAA0978014.1 SDR family oxidoreductase [Paeniglutamicibacter gangotriensis]
MSVIAVTGATGYIGGRLVPILLAQGHKIRVMTRRASALRDVPWRSEVEVVEGDLTDHRAARELCEGVDVLYYLVHSMGGRSDFVSVEEKCANTIVEAAKGEEVKRLVYLSGLHPEGELSRHLTSRVRVGKILERSGIPTLTLQAGLIIGSGSASFEMVRHLTDVLPVMPAPRWVLNKVQPIAVRDALHYLSRAADLPSDVCGAYDIGGPDAYSYADIMRIYADAAQLRRPAILSLPVLTPWLSAQWVNLVTPIPRSLAIPLVESLQHDCVVRNSHIDEIIEPPEEGLIDYRRSVELALAKMENDEVLTTWATAQALALPAESLPSDPDWAGRRVYTDDRARESTASPASLFTVIQGIGGKTGYYSLPGIWALRGLMDKMVGGVGLRRGRRSPTTLALGDPLDWWRVEALVPDELLRLRAEMRVPGRAWLELSVEPKDGGGSHYRQRAVFFPRGLAGRLYWFSILPFHGIIFSSMAKRITSAAESLEEEKSER